MTQLVVTPHPVLVDRQRTVFAPLHPGESLYAYLQRHVPEMDGQPWVVCIGGRQVPRHLWHAVKPKDGNVIELRGALGNDVLRLVAFAALTYVTFGIGSAGGAAAAAFGGGLAGYAFASAIFIAGSMLINKVLGPKPPSAAGAQAQDNVYSIGAARNQARQRAPFALVFGEVRATPDYLSQPYTFYRGNDQYVAMQFTPGMNCQSIGPLYNGDALLSTFDGVQTAFAGFPGMPEQAALAYGNADTLDGGALDNPRVWVQRTTSANTTAVMLNYSYILFDTKSDGKAKYNQEYLTAQYRVAGSDAAWTALAHTYVRSKEQTEQRVTVEFKFPAGAGQYEIRVSRDGQDTGGKGARIQMSWVTLNSIQQDTADYTGIARLWVVIKASGQLNGYPGEIRGVVNAEPMPVWTPSGWATATDHSDGLSNPGAQLLKYARGHYMQTPGGPVRYAGLGLTDDMIDIESLKAFMLYCADHGFTYDYIVKDAKSHDEVCNTIALAGLGQISWAGGKFSVMWAGADQPVSAVVNMATMKKASFQVDYALVSAADGIEYSYFDRLTWETKTVYVNAPGVTTALNPAKITGEGVSTEQHAAIMARYHLAQSLYQFKSITFNTDLEHLTYKRMSRLQLQHDLTQWGYGGRLVGASRAGNVVTLNLDEEVPAPATGTAWIGVRVSGENVYRVLPVQSFSGTSKSIVLSQPWPSDADFPGSSNPAHDCIWIYDFKQTPGYSVRVTSIEPESDMKGAQVSVVPESPEFWTYVLTGDYRPPVPGTALKSRPVASNVRVSEQNNVQGNTIYTTLQVAFDIAGDMQYAAIFAQSNEGGTDELVEVAQTQTRAASFRIPGPGTYAIVVRPYDRDGIVGAAASTVYTTQNAQPVPALFDTFTITEDGSGARRYSWGYNADTIQSPDLLGAEIRFTAGSVTVPNWDTLLQLGDGYHTGPFESVLPVSGTWTFAIRARNTSGVLSADMRTLIKTLGKSTSELMTDQQANDAALNLAITKEIQDRINADAAAASAAATDATNKANAARDAAVAQVTDITGAETWVSTKAYTLGFVVKSGNRMYQALQAIPAGTAVTNADYWKPVGNFASFGQAIASTVSLSTQNASDIATTSTQLNGVLTRMPTGTGALATSAAVTSESSARSAADTALATRVDGVVAKLPADGGKSASDATVTQLQTAMASADQQLAQNITTAQTTANNAQGTATQALTAANNNATAITQVSAAATNRDNLIKTDIFDSGIGTWMAPAYVESPATGAAQPSTTFYGAKLLLPPTKSSYELYETHAAPGDVIDVSANIYNTASASGTLGIHVIKSDGSNDFLMPAAPAPGTWVKLQATFTLPAGTARIRALFNNPNSDNYVNMTQPRFTRRSVADNSTASVAQALTASLNTLTGKYNASYTLALQVNGYISGIRSENTGTTTTFDVVADTFRIVSPNGGERLEYSSNNLRVYDANGVLIVRIGRW